MKYNVSPNVLLVSIVSILPKGGFAVAKSVEGDPLKIKLPFANRRRFVSCGGNHVFTDVRDKPALIEPGTKIACQIDQVKNGETVAIAWANYDMWCNPTYVLREQPAAVKPQVPVVPQEEAPVKSEALPASAPAKRSEKPGFRPPRFKQRGSGPWKAKHREVSLPKPNGPEKAPRPPKVKTEPVVVPHVMEELPPPTPLPMHQVLVTDGNLFLRVFERRKGGGKGRRIAEGRLSKLATRSLEFSGGNFLIEVRPNDVALSAFFPCNNVFTDIAAGMDRTEGDVPQEAEVLAEA